MAQTGILERSEFAARPQRTSWAAFSSEGASLAQIANVALAVLFAANLWFFAVAAHRITNLVSGENGLLETMQLAVMVPAFLLFVHAFRQGAGAVKFAGALLAMLVAAAFIRESDLVEALWPAAAMGLSGARAQYAVFVLAAAAAFAYIVLRRQDIPGLIRLALSWRSWPLYASLVPLMLIAKYDDAFGASRAAHFWEEMAEYNAYLLLLIAAWRHAALVKTQDWLGTQPRADYRLNPV